MATRAERAPLEPLGLRDFPLEARSRHREAIQAYRRSLALRPGDKATRYTLIRAFAQNAEAPAAASELCVLRELDPTAAEELRAKLGW